MCPIHVPLAAAAAPAPLAPAAGMACRGFLQCLLKLFNFALAIVGVLLIVYSLSRLVHLDPDLHPPSPPSSSPSPSPSSLSSSSRLAPVSMHLSSPLPGATQLVSGSSSSSSSSASSLGGRRQLGVSSNELRLPYLWFIYVLVGGGALLTLVTIVGAVAAESNNGCCLSCYQFGLCVLLLIQGSLAALVWLQDVPEDPTGEYERERAFVLRNLDLCRLAAVSLLLVEGTALLLAMMLSAMHSDAALADHDDDYIPPHPHPNSRLRQPLLRPPHMAPPPPYSAAIPSSSADAAAAGGGSGVSGVGVGGAADGAAAAAAGGEGGAAALSDAWRNRILEKAGCKRCCTGLRPSLGCPSLPDVPAPASATHSLTHLLPHPHLPRPSSIPSPATIPPTPRFPPPPPVRAEHQRVTPRRQRAHTARAVATDLPASACASRPLTHPPPSPPSSHPSPHPSCHQYGLDTNEFHHPVNAPHAPPMPPQPPPSSSACALM
ncbi:unnamed protein product [Closterium sp. Naga37s-1]|nr:unnamed protein product [Closterium sp. Naga37s-1]